MKDNEFNRFNDSNSTDFNDSSTKSDSLNIKSNNFNTSNKKETSKKLMTKPKNLLNTLIADDNQNLVNEFDDNSSNNTSNILSHLP